MVVHVIGWMAELNGHMWKMRKIFVENLFVSLLTTYKVQVPYNLHSCIIITSKYSSPCYWSSEHKDMHVPLVSLLTFL